jgi:basic membrane protein A
MRKMAVVLILFLIFPLVITSCGSASEKLASKSFKPCVVSGIGGFDDNSYSWSALEGIKKVSQELGVEYGQFEVDYSTLIVPQLEEAVAQNCTLIIAMSYDMHYALEDFVPQHPEVNFVLVDSVLDQSFPNLKSISFDVSQPAFLAGYASAAISKTGVVAEYGGVKIPPLLPFMDGYSEGIDYYNAQKGAHVKLLGWNRATQSGEFAGGFMHQEEGKVLAQFFMDFGADVIFPVADNTGLGTLQYVKTHNEENSEHPKVSVVWVDNDGSAIMPEYSDIILTSVEKAISNSIIEVVREASAGNFDNTTYVGTFANNGVLIAPWHEFEKEISPELNAELEVIKKNVFRKNSEKG